MTRACLALVVALVFVAAAGASPKPPLPKSVTISPTDGRIAWVDGWTWQVWVANADGTSAHKLGAPFTDNGVAQLAWTKAGIVIDSNFRLFLLTGAGKRVKVGSVGDETFSVAGELAASGSAGCGFCHGPVTIYNVRTHAARRVGNANQANTFPALSPDGARVAYTRSSCGPPSGECINNPALVVTSLNTGVTRRIGPAASCTQWSPDGRTISYIHVYVPRSSLESVSASGGTPRVLLQPAVCRGDRSPAWSPDSKSLAFDHNNRLTVLDAATRKLKMARALGTMISLAWSPDGTSLVAAFRNGSCGDIYRFAIGNLAPQPVFRGCP